MRNVILLLCLAAFLGGCVSGPLYSEVSVSPNNKAIVYFYRPYRAFNEAGLPNIYINDVKTFSLKNKSYSVFFLDPGEHKVKVEGSKLINDWDLSPIKATYFFEANKSYYIRIVPQITSVYSMEGVVSVTGEANISILLKDEAEQEISKTQKVVEPQI